MRLPKARENAGDQVVFGFFSFAANWLGEWCEFSGPITKRSKAKTRHSGLILALN